MKQEIYETISEKEYYMNNELTEVVIGNEITEIPAYAFGECRKIRTVSFGEKIKRIKRSAFYNCRSLKKIVINGIIEDIEDGAFRNCESLSEIEIHNVHNDLTCLKAVIPELEQAITVHFYMESGDEAELYLTKTIYAFEANEPARVFVQEDYGSGVYYRQCVNTNKPDWEKYDNVFEVAKNEEDKETIFNIIFSRLAYPYMLGSFSENRYVSYIHKEIKAFFTDVAKGEHFERAELMCGKKLLNKEECELGIRISTDFDRPRLSLILMDYMQNEFKKHGGKLEL